MCLLPKKKKKNTKRPKITLIIRLKLDSCCLDHNTRITKVLRVFLIKKSLALVVHQTSWKTFPYFIHFLLGIVGQFDLDSGAILVALSLIRLNISRFRVWIASDRGKFGDTKPLQFNLFQH